MPIVSLFANWAQITGVLLVKIVNSGIKLRTLIFEGGQSEHFNFFDHGGGAFWDSNVFFKSATYLPTLRKFRGA